MDDDLVPGTDGSPTSLRARVADWTVAILVAIGLVASIPMLPILLVGLVFMAIRSPGAPVLIATQVADRSGTGRLEGFSGRYLFPMVTAGWLLICLVVTGIIAGDPNGSGTRNTGLAWVVGVTLFLGVTFTVYRSMHRSIREVPFDEWLGGRRPGPVGIVLLIWIAGVGLVTTISIWTASIDGLWKDALFATSMLVLFVLPLLLILIKPKGSPGLYRILAVVGVASLVTVLASVAGLTPAPGSP